MERSGLGGEPEPCGDSGTAVSGRPSGYLIIRLGKFRVCREFYRKDTRQQGSFWGCVTGLVNRAPQFA
ncbi:hypothetical protein GCM10010841_31260 [Deinococcus aerophilus]|uniref:Uncharacterized protein n=1 Tax=Deinococcus aerophilus TaxID=522488 RepID=A0ABQ2H0V4_9DEIO|nr:hypothetical protein GCM10010841_31260 [Deinococcus aerophilus]